MAQYVPHQQDPAFEMPIFNKILTNLPKKLRVIDPSLSKDGGQSYCFGIRDGELYKFKFAHSSTLGVLCRPGEHYNVNSDSWTPDQNANPNPKASSRPKPPNTIFKDINEDDFLLLNAPELDELKNDISHQYLMLKKLEESSIEQATLDNWHIEKNYINDDFFILKNNVKTSSNLKNYELNNSQRGSLKHSVFYEYWKILKQELPSREAYCTSLIAVLKGAGNEIAFDKLTSDQRIQQEANINALRSCLISKEFIHSLGWKNKEGKKLFYDDSYDNRPLNEQPKVGDIYIYMFDMLLDELKGNLIVNASSMLRQEGSHTSELEMEQEISAYAELRIQNENLHYSSLAVSKDYVTPSELLRETNLHNDSVELYHMITNSAYSLANHNSDRLKHIENLARGIMSNDPIYAREKADLETIFYASGLTDINRALEEISNKVRQEIENPSDVHHINHLITELHNPEILSEFLSNEKLLELQTIIQGIVDQNPAYVRYLRNLENLGLTTTRESLFSQLQLVQQNIVVQLLNHSIPVLTNIVLETTPLSVICNAMLSKIGHRTFTQWLLTDEKNLNLLTILSKINQLSPNKFLEIIKEKDISGDTILHIALYHSRTARKGQERFEVFASILTTIPEEERFNIVMTPNSKGTTVIEQTFDSNAPMSYLYVILKNLPESKRLNILTTPNNDGNIPLFRMLSHKDGAKALIMILNSDQLLYAMSITDGSGRKFGEVARNIPAFWKIISEALPKTPVITSDLIEKNKAMKSQIESIVITKKSDFTFEQLKKINDHIDLLSTEILSCPEKDHDIKSEKISALRSLIKLSSEKSAIEAIQQIEDTTKIRSGITSHRTASLLDDLKSELSSKLKFK